MKYSSLPGWLLLSVMVVGLVVAWLPAARAQSPFSDVPEDYWAFPWIREAAETGLVRGYWDGTYHPEDTVTRAQMAVYIVRLLDYLRGRRGVGWIMPSFDSGPGTYWIFTPCLTDAWDYRLYSSTNGVDFTLVTGVGVNVTEFGFIQREVSGVTTETIYKAVALVGDPAEERQLCHLLTLRPGTPTAITIDSPPETDASRVPLIEWDPVSNAVAYVAAVMHDDAGEPAVDYIVIVEGWRTGIRFNQQFGPGVTMGLAANPLDPQPLEGDADYDLMVLGLDAGGYAFAQGVETFHTLP